MEKRYDPQEVERRLAQFWEDEGIYHFDPEENGKPVYSIDTPPATVSGHLHLGHTYSYSHPDFIARFWRMNGYNVYYPMGYDDNGLPTERLVEKQLKSSAREMGRQAFIRKCLEISVQAEGEYERLWKRLGLSIDWRYTYRTIDDLSRRTSQLSFLELYRQGRVYRGEAPTIWCPECRTAIAQADLEDMQRSTEYVTLAFRVLDAPDQDENGVLKIATTRPELLPACVAVFVHPGDPRYRDLIGRTVRVPLFNQEVPVLSDPGADPEKGTGAVMCCTFGDSTDVNWWRTHSLPHIEALDSSGRMTKIAGSFAGMTIQQARREIKAVLQNRSLLIGRQPTEQSVRVHERCDTPVEYLITRQWFIRILDRKEELLEAGENVNWYPGQMKARYRAWVENLNWDWCISRQRYYGVPFPVWYCKDCGEPVLAEADELPVDPLAQKPAKPCACGGCDFTPEGDVLDTWATSSLSPQIAGAWLADPDLYEKVFPFSLRPQAHEIIRTWAFYTIVKSTYHFEELPWKDALISGWGVAGEGMGKISKSRGSGPMPPLEMIERYSADALRYWASSTSPGKDSVISEEKIQAGARLVTKLWNVGRFCERFILPEPGDAGSPANRNWVLDPESATPADRWILSRLQSLTARTTALMQVYDYAAAKNEIEMFFWHDVADNYLEMCKQRLYTGEGQSSNTARLVLREVMLNTLKLFAPFLPFVTEEIYRNLFARQDGKKSIHLSTWPIVNPSFQSAEAESFGEMLVEIASAIRRYKSEHNLSLGTELDEVQLAAEGEEIRGRLRSSIEDLKSITRARSIRISSQLSPGAVVLASDALVRIGINGEPGKACAAPARDSQGAFRMTGQSDSGASRDVVKK